ncbi:CheR family methyltransferase [Alkalibacter saccharofermentans]|uniref:Chemotaxis protein methyltransferase CheR n=1 Tax=Alkalibacter saccharofermentans DSM 14828 TaxID=1120975 RepID=A0A1M4SQ57_9FIRM|nr:protein-glutamate O-methyltransferase CheR [Alkalibacter saccharofermentans]SHE34383.1 chemotaxis protein methyltransferase CheR [Alkalibacter saccharofermentans DSM 14828]
MNNEIIHSVRSIYGLDISKYDISFLKRAVEKRCSITETKNISDYIQYLSSNSDEATILFQSLNIIHTEFFRNPLTFAHLEQWILPRLMEEKSDNNELRIWSAGCSSGQEVYSIAMLIESITSKKQIKKRYRIIATDISESALHAAKKGEYNEKDIQMIRVKDLNDFFVKSGEKYKVCDRLKQHVSFSTYDLLDNRSACPQESIFGNFDLVVCSNMLFYYKPNYQHNMVKKLIDSMDEHGYLITGEAEMQIVAKFKDLFLVVPPSPIFKKRRGAK